ncbi:MAG TPA: cytochrome c [Gammaproteobacteria bacterium]
MSEEVMHRLHGKRGAERRMGSEMRRLLLALGAAALSSLPGVSLADGDAERGQALYRIYCTQCHGLQGNGRGVNVPDMAVMPRDHTDRVEMSARTDEDLFKAIQGGGKAVDKSVLMPAWGGNFSDENIRDLVAYLRKLCCSEAQ